MLIVIAHAKLQLDIMACSTHTNQLINYITAHAMACSTHRSADELVIAHAKPYSLSDM